MYNDLIYLYMKAFMTLLLALITGACSNSNSAPATTTAGIIAEQLLSGEDIALQQSQPVSLAIAIVNDISGSYRLNPESFDLNVLYQAFPACKGRIVIGYTLITEDSYTPILRYSYTPFIPLIPQESIQQDVKEARRDNPWIQREKKTNNDPRNDIQRANHHIDSLNSVIDSLNRISFASFSSKIDDKLNRPIARRSDVIGALRRASTFLGEFDDCPRILMVCSDFKDNINNNQSMTLDTAITLFIVGSNVDPKDVKSATGMEKSGYRLFESYEEALNQMIRKYMYNP